MRYCTSRDRDCRINDDVCIGLVELRARCGRMVGGTICDYYRILLTGEEARIILANMVSTRWKRDSRMEVDGLKFSAERSFGSRRCPVQVRRKLDIDPGQQM
jgi:hypothetical protein